MANGLTVENVSLAQVMSVEGAAQSVSDMVVALESEPKVKKLLDVARTVEDMYQAVKDYVSLKLEDFKVLFQKSVDYFKESKAALADEVLDNVVGGGWGFSLRWQKLALAATLLIGGIVEGALIGAAVGGPIGAGFGAFAGLFAGAFIAGGALDAINQAEVKKG